jgi:two-component system chemotaxis response regulator CheB
MAKLLPSLINENVNPAKEIEMSEKKKTLTEVQIALERSAIEEGILQIGKATHLTCPDCNGVLSAIKEGDLVRYRCHTGHAFSSDSLLSAISESIEHSLWNSVRAIEEIIIMLNKLGDHFADKNQPKLSALYFKKAKEAEGRAQLLRLALSNHENLSSEIINDQQ